MTIGGDPRIRPNDPATNLPVGPEDDVTGSWRVSLAEIDAMGRKAARGAGYGWGLAEEAGRAARWLAAYRRPGPEALLIALDATDGRTRAHAPCPDRPLWAPEAEALCPVATGAAVSDRIEAVAAGAAIELGPVIAPLLVVPFLCRAARDLCIDIRLGGEGIDLVATPAGPAAADWSGLMAERVARLAVSRAEGALPAAPEPPGAGPWRIAVETWRGLDRFAHRTYAPATEASRAGAGAGLRDTD